MSPKELSEISNGSWDNCKMYVLKALTDLDKKVDRIQWLLVTTLVSALLALILNIVGRVKLGG
jgi:hypothetical protein